MTELDNLCPQNSLEYILHFNYISSTSITMTIGEMFDQLSH